MSVGFQSLKGNLQHTLTLIISALKTGNSERALSLNLLLKEIER
ncbi:hypothetical protein PEDI_28600 [Persicobacter diffluens]|uniref:Uncharacterized protein n=1 Tax=Persicobacter diffluens TaxID=981 RepID=A0AAN5AMX7_9BACT|nr:hypothetical protein PEDI_28600 [Persicobacter diffluens]